MRLPAALACATLVVACSDSPTVTLDDFAGAYSLVSIGGAELPLRTVISGDTHYVWSEHLIIQRGPQARTETRRETRRQNGSVQTYTMVNDYVTHVEGDALVMMFVCPINAICSPPSPVFLFVEPDGVRLERRDPSGPWRYVRMLEALGG